MVLLGCSEVATRWRSQERGTYYRAYVRPGPSRASVFVLGVRTLIRRGAACGVRKFTPCTGPALARFYLVPAAVAGLSSLFRRRWQEDLSAPSLDFLSFTFPSDPEVCSKVPSLLSLFSSRPLKPDALLPILRSAPPRLHRCTLSRS